jgi:hypothetical protein
VIGIRSTVRCGVRGHSVWMSIGVLVVEAAILAAGRVGTSPRLDPPRPAGWKPATTILGRPPESLSRGVARLSFALCRQGAPLAAGVDQEVDRYGAIERAVVSDDIRCS